MNCIGHEFFSSHVKLKPMSRFRSVCISPCRPCYEQESLEFVPGGGGTWSEENQKKGKSISRCLEVNFSLFCKLLQARTMEYYKQRFRKNLAQLLEEEAGEQEGEVTPRKINRIWRSICVTGALPGSTVARVQHSPQEALCSVRLPQVANGPVEAISSLAVAFKLTFIFQWPLNLPSFCSSYSCSTCGARYCSLRCLETHEDTRQKLGSLILITENYQVPQVDRVKVKPCSPGLFLPQKFGASRLFSYFLIHSHTLWRLLCTADRAN